MASPAAADNLGLLRRLYDALEAGDVGAIRSLVDPAVVVRLAGAGELDGTYRGTAEVERLYQRVTTLLGDGFKVPQYEVLVHDHSLVVVPRGSTFGEADRGMDVYHFAEGRILEIWLTAWRPADWTPESTAGRVTGGIELERQPPDEGEDRF
jgi:ketosteroid isomerase-like protein